jgi:mevalonate kinase
MSFIDLKLTASAPGKVILFGEHAVVWGVTAIAAALSDLRIFVEMVCI